MLGMMPEVLMSRIPFVSVLLAVVLGAGLAACDDGSDSERKPRRSTSTSTSTSTASPTSSTVTTAPPVTVPPANANGTCGNQTDAIVAAIGGSGGNELVQQGGYTVKRCRLAASSPIWAAADVVPKPGILLDEATAVLQRIGALWNVMEISAALSCTDVPANIRTELALAC
jgi:hypothetical protein